MRNKKRYLSQWAVACAVATSLSFAVTHAATAPPGMQGATPPAGTIATASSAVSVAPPAYAIDGNLGTPWNSGTYSGTLQLNFPSPQLIGSIQIDADAYPNMTESFTINGLKNGKWVQIGNSKPMMVYHGGTILAPIPVMNDMYDGIQIVDHPGASWAAINEVTLIPTGGISPNVPLTVTDTRTTTTTSDLAWSVDDTYHLVDHYVVKRDGTQVYSGKNTSFHDTGLTSNTSYLYTVEEFDANNQSLGKKDVTLKTQESLDTVATLNGTTTGQAIYSSDVTVGIQPVDTVNNISQILYSQNGGDWNTYSTPLTEQQDGVYKIDYKGVDSNGTAGPVHTATFTVDKTAPATAIAAPNITNQNATVSMSSTDNLSGIAYSEYRINGGEWVRYTGDFTLTDEGTYVVEYRSVDNAGNVEPTQSKTIVVDKTAPVTVAILPPDNGSGWYPQEVDVNWNCNEDAHIQYRINGGDWIDGTYDPLHFSHDGIYTLEYRSIDDAGNIEETKSTTIKIDTTPPDLTVSVPTPTGSNGWYNDSATITVDAADGGSGVKGIYFSVDGGPAKVYGGPISIKSDHDCNFKIWVVDGAGNTTIKWVHIQVDKTPPTLNITLDKTMLWPPNHKLVPIHVTVDASDSMSGIASVVLTSITSNEPDDGLGDGDTANDIQGADFGTLDTDFYVRAERSGTGSGRVYTVTYTATDKAGNVTIATATITVPHDMSGKNGK